MSFFKVLHQDARCRARSGVFQTAHGSVRTPVFMPVGTQATVKDVSAEELKGLGAEIILSNAYHLYLRPGQEVILQAGGLHRFMGWQGPILTDSGGFQIFSLAKLNKVCEEGVTFQSHIDGSRHFLTPEKVIEIQRALGSDVMMPLDECLKYPVEKKQAEESVQMTHRWARRSLEAWKSSQSESASGVLFGIVQGGAFTDLRIRAARQMTVLDFPGYAIGGLSVGEPSAVMDEMLGAVLPELPQEKPRYLMGVGLVRDLFEAVSMGVDMFDCVVPTRNGRNATVYTQTGKLLLRSAVFAKDWRPIEESCPCYGCRNHSRAYLRHLFNAHENLGGRLAALHNLTFFIQLLDSMRRAIEESRFEAFRRGFERNYHENEADA